jgi:hypothetical protein
MNGEVITPRHRAVNELQPTYLVSRPNQFRPDIQAVKQVKCEGIWAYASGPVIEVPVKLCIEFTRFNAILLAKFSKLRKRC